MSARKNDGKTRRGSKGPGYDYGSRRYPGYFLSPGKFSKNLTNRLQRQQQCKFEPVEEEQCLNCGNKYDVDASMWWCTGCCLRCAY